MTDTRFQPEITEPCPFCGSKDVEMCHTATNWPAVGCNECGALGPCTDLHSAKAIEAWDLRAPAVSPLTVEDVYANCQTTLIGFSDELTERNIKFICDQISRKVMLALAALPSEAIGREAAIEECLAIVDKHLNSFAGPQYRAACENIGKEIAALAVSRPTSLSPDPRVDREIGEPS